MDPCAGCGEVAADELPARFLAGDLGLTSVRCHDAAGCWARARDRFAGLDGGGYLVEDVTAERVPGKAPRLVRDDRCTLQGPPDRA